MNSEKSGISLHMIPGLNVQRGIAMTGGTETGYHEVLAIFCKDAEDRLPLLQSPPETGEASALTLPLFVTYVHALKSASGSIGAANVSELAQELERAGEAGNLALIKDKLPVFAQQLAELVNNIKSAMEQPETQTAGLSISNIHLSLFTELAAALDSGKAGDIGQIMKEIREISLLHPLDSEGRETLEKIFDEVMMAEYGNAKRIVEKILEEKHGS